MGEPRHRLTTSVPLMESREKPECGPERTSELRQTTKRDICTNLDSLARSRPSGDCRVQTNYCGPVGRNDVRAENTLKVVERDTLAAAMRVPHSTPRHGKGWRCGKPKGSWQHKQDFLVYDWKRIQRFVMESLRSVRDMKQHHVFIRMEGRSHFRFRQEGAWEEWQRWRYSIRPLSGHL